VLLLDHIALLMAYGLSVHYDLFNVCMCEFYNFASGTFQTCPAL